MAPTGPFFTIEDARDTCGAEVALATSAIIEALPDNPASLKAVLADCIRAFGQEREALRAALNFYAERRHLVAVAQASLAVEDGKLARAALGTDGVVGAQLVECVELPDLYPPPQPGQSACPTCGRAPG
jgi:hypothetical protein